MPMPEFENEAKFRTEWIAPFLSKLGYILPKHVHGANEQGEDFYFAEHDNFGHLRFLAAQVKNGNIGGGDTETDNLLNQVRRCFAVTLKHHKGAENQRISAVYIMASSKISSNAREYISDSIRAEHYGENVYYLDGETLYNLERHTTYIDDRNTRQRLVALLNEILFNRRAHFHLRTTSAEKKPNFLYCRMLVLNDCLTAPLPEELLPQKFLTNYWAYAAEHSRYVNNLPMKYDIQKTLSSLRKTQSLNRRFFNCQPAEQSAFLMNTTAWNLKFQSDLQRLFPNARWIGLNPPKPRNCGCGKRSPA